ncbi:MAG: hypothetical protein ACQETQ_13830 [Spirochaetota bacterium]
MYALSDDSLQVSILDPIADRDRMGPRYCTGGYIFQIEDDGRPLLSGPTYPESFNWFDGQGIPDSFAPGALRSTHSPSSHALIPGIGVCDTSTKAVLEHCEWSVRAEARRIGFRTTQSWQDYSFVLDREVSLSGRVLSSYTRIENLTTVQMPISWFPHPFYPLPSDPDSALCSFPAPVKITPGSTFSLSEDGYLRCSDPSTLQPASVRCNSEGPLTIMQRHPLLGLVAARYSFAAGHIVAWANTKTFSFEPYLEQTIGGRMAFEWSAEYHF